MDPSSDLDRFYAAMAELRQRCGGERLLETCDGRVGWPTRGVYFFFEPGEYRADGVTLRVVRVGTHGLRPSKSTLWSRLSAHRGPGAPNAARGGNHRGSIFRLHVGSALLATGDWPQEIGETWGVGQSAPPDVRRAEHPLECAVSAYVGRMPLLWIEVDDAPDASSERGVIERSAIALLSNLSGTPCDPPSPTWLGYSAGRDLIRQSGLWNVNHVTEQYDPGFVEVLERRIG